MVGLPLILFGVGEAKKLSDIEYLSIKEFDGKRVDVDTETTVSNTLTETDIATQTATTGKDMYLARAKLSLIATAGTGSNFPMEYRLYANGVEIEKIEDQVLLTGADSGATFTTQGVKVAAGQIIKMTLKHQISTRTVRVNAKLELWEETTGESPAV